MVDEEADKLRLLLASPKRHGFEHSNCICKKETDGKWCKTPHNPSFAELCNVSVRRKTVFWPFSGVTVVSGLCYYLFL